MSLTAAVWPQFATQLFRDIRFEIQVFRIRLTCIGSYENKQVTTFTFRAQATTCSKYHTRTQVASVHHEYGRLTLATAGILLLLFYISQSFYKVLKEKPVSNSVSAADTL